MAKDLNPRRYTLKVNEVIPQVGTADKPGVTIEIQGKLSARAKREIVLALEGGDFKITERVLA